VQTLQDALAENPSGMAALEAAQALIDRIEIKPAATTPGYEVEMKSRRAFEQLQSAGLELKVTAWWAGDRRASQQTW
jgi:hypothetical protein